MEWRFSRRPEVRKRVASVDLVASSSPLMQCHVEAIQLLTRSLGGFAKRGARSGELRDDLSGFV